MSQSLADVGEVPSDAKARADNALIQMMHQGRSFSGRERHCFFLNTQAPSGADVWFANVSAVSGLDFADDGRAVAIVDWDGDGDLDLWITNRTAPRVRLLRNQGGRSGRFVAFRLRGTSCNRDAIGARLTLSLKDGTNLVKTLHAGDGFLAGSSKWVHFGLGDQHEIENLEVRWPGKEAENFAGIGAGRFYRHFTD